MLRRTAAELDRLGEVEVLALSGQSYMEYGGDFVFTVVVTLAGGEE